MGKCAIYYRTEIGGGNSNFVRYYHSHELSWKEWKKEKKKSSYLARNGNNAKIDVFNLTESRKNIFPRLI